MAPRHHLITDHHAQSPASELGTGPDSRFSSPFLGAPCRRQCTTRILNSSFLLATTTGVRKYRSRAGQRLAETRWTPVRDKSKATLAEPVRSGTRNRSEVAARHGQTRSVIISSLDLHTPPWFVFFRHRVTRGCCPSLQKPPSPGHGLRGGNRSLRLRDAFW